MREVTTGGARERLKNECRQIDFLSAKKCAIARSVRACDREKEIDELFNGA